MRPPVTPCVTPGAKHQIKTSLSHSFYGNIDTDNRGGIHVPKAHRRLYSWRRMKRLREFDTAATFALTATCPHFTIILKAPRRGLCPLDQCQSAGFLNASNALHFKFDSSLTLNRGDYAPQKNKKGPDKRGLLLLLR